MSNMVYVVTGVENGVKVLMYASKTVESAIKFIENKQGAKRDEILGDIWWDQQDISIYYQIYKAPLHD